MLRFQKSLYILIPLLIAMSAWVQVMIPAESDKGWLLHAAHKWLEGGRLYVDIFEVNPPLIVWIYALPAWISTRFGGIRDFEALAYMGLAVSLFSAWVCMHVIASHPAFEQSGPRRILFGLLLALIFIFYNRQSFFFDREHIFFVLAMPYMLRFMPSLAERTPSLRLRLLIGCMAAAGFCIKPHTIIIFAVLQLLTLLRTGRLISLLHLENRIIAAQAALYLLCIYRFAPEYFTVVLPMALATYGSFGSINSGPASYLPPFLVGMAFIFLHFRPHATPYRKDVYYLAGICAAFLLYALAGNGWDYTYNPLYSMLMLMSAWLLWEYDWLRAGYEARELPAKDANFGRRGCLLVMGLNAGSILLYLGAMAFHAHYARMSCQGSADCPLYTPPAKYMVQHHDHSFGTITLDFSNWIALTRVLGARWDTRFNHLWMMSKLMQSDAAFKASHRWITEKVARGFAEDLDRKQPDIVIVDNSPAFIGWPHPFDLPGFFSTVPEFKRAWLQYRYDSNIDFCVKYVSNIPIACRYDIYRRIRPAENHPATLKHGPQ